MQINLTAIGAVRSPYSEPAGMPIQGTFKPETLAYIELESPYEQGLADLEGFSHAILIYRFHLATDEKLLTKPFLEDVEHGVFATRSPNRPNHLGLSIVRIARIIDNRLFFTEVDIIDGTPVLDIKPFVKHFDNRDNTRHGWLDKHFDGNTPLDRTIIE